MTTETKLPVQPESRVPERPLGFFDDLREEMERMWGRPFGFPAFGPGKLGRKLGWMPTTDVIQKNGDLFVKADLPGVGRDDVRVSLAGDSLEIRGERRRERDVTEKDFHRSECEYGGFYRRIPLAFAPDPTTIEAKFADGVLEVRIPMPAVKQPDSTPIKIS